MNATPSAWLSSLLICLSLTNLGEASRLECTELIMTVRDQAKLRGELAEVLTDASIREMELLYEQASPYQKSMMRHALEHYRLQNIEGKPALWMYRAHQLLLSDFLLQDDFLALYVLHEVIHVFDLTPASGSALTGFFREWIQRRFYARETRKHEVRVAMKTAEVLDLIAEDPPARRLMYESLARKMELGPREAEALVRADWRGNALLELAEINESGTPNRDAVSAAFANLGDEELVTFAVKVYQFAQREHLFFPAFQRNRNILTQLIEHRYRSAIAADVVDAGKMSIRRRTAIVWILALSTGGIGAIGYVNRDRLRPALKFERSSAPPPSNKPPRPSTASDR